MSDITAFNTRVYIAEVCGLKDEAFFSECLKKVSHRRKEKVQRFRLLEDRMLSLGAGILMEKALSDIGLELGLDRDEIDIREEKDEKPSIQRPDGLFFNLSHSGIYTICALSSCKVGCDIQQVKKYDIQVAKRFFAEKELRYILSGRTQEEQRDRFYRIWTLKESYVKMVGSGIGETFSEFTVRALEAGETGMQIINGKEYHFKEYPAPEGYHISCCAERNDYEREIRLIHLKDISIQ